MNKNLPICPVEITLSLIGDRWKVLIIRDLLDGTKRFGELKKSLGTITQKVLTSNLRAMEESGVLTRKVYAEVPPRVEYTLTQTGYSLKPIGTITQKVLTSNLRAMEESGVLTRKVYAEVPPRVEYTLTQTGYSLKPILDAMVQWGDNYKKTREKTS